MEKNEKYVQTAAPMLFPIEPEQFWQMLRILVREEVNRLLKPGQAPTFQTPGLTYKPLFKITEVCELLHITKPTIYEWIRHGKLKPYKIQSRVYFLWQDIQLLLNPTDQRNE
ncbi:DNA-binding protein [Chitinophaga silvatica]|uniref:DNA-binding protein n=1 Tax=Chitinophaga silvatica TaxID=2282649 RepID=A0A3E1Y669_9BACT|nr:helix-turn-helix domain-containing protein [Chitinophaga silvatica]RFS20221.1 DNA-binding protein [Chitinophaga silvatica]